VVAVVAGEGNKRLFETLGAAAIVEGGQSMNPSTAEILAALGRVGAPEAILLPNNANVLMSAEQAATLAEKPVVVLPTRSLQAGLAAMVAYEGGRPATELADEMKLSVDGLATGAVTRASREVELRGEVVRPGDYIGLLEDEPVLGAADFNPVACELIELLLAQDRHVLTLLTGAEAPPLDALVRRLEELHPGLELEVHEGG